MTQKASSDSIKYWWKPEHGIRDKEIYMGKARYNLKNTNPQTSIDEYACLQALQLDNSIEVDQHTSVTEFSQNGSNATCDYTFSCNNMNQNLKSEVGQDTISVPFNKITYKDLKKSKAKVLTSMYLNSNDKDKCDPQEFPGGIYNCGLPNTPKANQCPCPVTETTNNDPDCKANKNCCYNKIKDKTYKLNKNFSLDNKQNKISDDFESSFKQIVTYPTSSCEFGIPNNNNTNLFFNGQLGIQYDKNSDSAISVDSLDGWPSNICPSDKPNAIVDQSSQNIKCGN